MSCTHRARQPPQRLSLSCIIVCVTTTTDHKMPRVLNPLWIISLLLGLCEVVVGIAATQTVEWIQGVFAIFSVIFPIGISIVFFSILWKRPFVFYAPRDYSEKSSVTDFVEAISPRLNNERKLEQVARTVAETMIVKLGTASGDSLRMTEVINEAAKATAEYFELRIITLKFPEKIQIPMQQIIVTKSTTVEEYLDQVYFVAQGYIKPYTYGKSWQLYYFSKDGCIFPLRTAISETGSDPRRLLSVVGSRALSQHFELINQP